LTSKIFSSKEQLARFLGDYLTELSEQDVQVNIALSGGSTPQTIFDSLAQEYHQTIKWKQLRFFWSDERCVSPEHSESNYKMARQHLFNHLSIPEENIFRIKGELSPRDAQDDYIAILDRELPKTNNIPVFDLIMLGMGDDGHTASIFPHEISLWNSPKFCEIGTHPSSGQKRVTLTGQIINNAKEIVFLVTGKNKAPIVNEILNQKPHIKQYPAALADSDKSIWLLDQEAVSSV
jgi:6-phosphogluconolactonase